MTSVTSAGERLDRELLADLNAAGCSCPVPLRSLMLGTLILSGDAGAYLTPLQAPGPRAGVLSLVVATFCNVQAGFVAHEAGQARIAAARTQSRL